MSRIREQFSTTALILSIIALVFALMGGAYAASQAQHKKAVVKRGPRGPKGPAGPTGPAGPVGAKGDTGTAGQNGEKGQKGDAGEKGDTGTAGSSVVVKEVVAPGFVECNEQGGVILEDEGSGEEAEICNGEKGAEGEEGSPWTVNGILPPGQTETGYWAFTAAPTQTSGFVWAPVSFTILLPQGISEGNVHYSNEGTFGTYCKGSSGTPIPVRPGTLCIFARGLFHAAFSPEEENQGLDAEKAGAALRFQVTGEESHGDGAFAVKARCATGEEEYEATHFTGNKVFLCRPAA